MWWIQNLLPRFIHSFFTKQFKRWAPRFNCAYLKYYLVSPPAKFLSYTTWRRWHIHAVAEISWLYILTVSRKRKRKFLVTVLFGLQSGKWNWPLGCKRRSLNYDRHVHRWSDYHRDTLRDLMCAFTEGEPSAMLSCVFLVQPLLFTVRVYYLDTGGKQ